MGQVEWVLQSKKKKKQGGDMETTGIGLVYYSNKTENKNTQKLKMDINVLKRQRRRRHREKDMERKHRGERYGEKTLRNAVNPQATEQSSGERKEEFLCAAGEQHREGGQRRKREIDRWKKRARTRGWPREFEKSVKGFDCSCEKGIHGEKMEQEWHKMTQNGHLYGWGDGTRMDMMTYGKKIGRRCVTVEVKKNEM